MRLAWRLIAILAVFMAVPGLAEDEAPVEPWSKVRIEVGLGSTTVIFTAITNRKDLWAERAAGGFFGEGDGCPELVAIEFEGKPLCKLFDYEQGGKSRDWSRLRPTVRIEGEQVTISMRRTFEGDARRFQSPKFQIGPAARPRTIIEVAYGKSFELSRTNPLPALMKTGLLRFRVEDVQKPDEIVQVQYALSMGEVAEKDRKRAERLPLSVSEMLPNGGRLLTADQWGRLAAELGRVLAALFPILLVLGLLQDTPKSGEDGTKRRRVIGLSRYLAILCLAGLLGNFVMTDRWMNEDAPDWLRAASGSLGEALKGMTGEWKSLHVELLATLMMAIFKTAVIGLFFVIIRRILRKGGWPFGLPIARPLMLAVMLIWVALPLPFLLDMLAATIDPAYPSWPYQAYQVIALVPAAAVAAWAVLAGFASFGRPLPSKARWLVSLGALVSMLPTEPMFSSTGGSRPAALGSVLSVYPNVGFYLTSLTALVAIIPALWLLRSGRLSPDEERNDKPMLAAGALMLALVAAAPASSWSGLLCVALALWLWPNAALTTKAQWQARLNGALAIKNDLPTWVSKLERAAELDGALRSTATTGKLVTGEMTPAEWVERRDALESARDAARDAVYFDKAPVRDFLLGVGIEPDPWRSGLRSLRYAAPVIAALTLLMIARTSTSDTVPILFWISNVSQTALPMAGLAILFGYFFDYLRGPTGLHKALYLGAILCLAELPAWSSLFVDGRALATMLWSFSQHFLILIPAGVAGFDYGRMRDIEGHRFDWRRFSWFGDARLLSAGLAAGAAAVAPTLATLFSGPFADAVKSMATIVAPILPTGR